MAAALGNDNDDDDACGVFESDDDGNAAVAATTLPDIWWRVLGISMEDIANAKDALQGVCA